MAGRANRERVLGERSDERLRQSLKNKNIGKTKEEKQGSTKRKRGVDLVVVS